MSFHEKMKAHCHFCLSEMLKVIWSIFCPLFPDASWLWYFSFFTIFFPHWFFHTLYSSETYSEFVSYVFIWARDDLLFIYFSGISTLITRLNALNYSTVYYMLDENIVRDLGNNCEMSEQLSAAFHKQIIFWPCPQMKVSILLQILSIWLHQIELYLHDRHRIIT